MKKILAIVLMTLLLVTPALASGEAVAQAPAAAPVAEPVCNHTFVVESVEATCTEKGLNAWTCSQCGYGFTMEVPAIGHVASAAAATCTEDVVCLNCGEVLETATGHAYTYQMDAVVAEDGSFSSFGTWACDNCGDVIDATEGNAVYYYGVEAEPAASSEEASAEASDEASAEAEPAAAAAAPANPNYDPAAYNWTQICLVLAIVVVVVGAVLMLSFGKKKKD